MITPILLTLLLSFNNQVFNDEYFVNEKSYNSNIKEEMTFYLTDTYGAYQNGKVNNYTIRYGLTYDFDIYFNSGNSTDFYVQTNEFFVDYSIYKNGSYYDGGDSTDSYTAMWSYDYADFDLESDDIYLSFNMQTFLFGTNPSYLVFDIEDDSFGEVLYVSNNLNTNSMTYYSTYNKIYYQLNAIDVYNSVHNYLQRDIDLANERIRGEQNGYKVGKDEGFAIGKQVGYDNGYAIGQSTQGEYSGTFSLLANAISVIDRVATIEILPNITLGTCISIPIIVGLIAVIFKMVK